MVGFGQPTTKSFGFGQQQQQQNSFNQGGMFATGNNTPTFGGFSNNANNMNMNSNMNSNTNSFNNMGFNNNAFNAGNQQQQQPSFSFGNLGQQKPNPFNTTQTPSFSNIPPQPPVLGNQFSFSSPSKPQSQSVFPQQSSGMSIFPALLSNPDKTPHINNAAVSLADKIILGNASLQPTNNMMNNTNMNMNNMNNNMNMNMNKMNNMNMGNPTQMNPPNNIFNSQPNIFPQNY